MGSIQPFIEVRPGLLKGVKLNENLRINLWKIFDQVTNIITRFISSLYLCDQIFLERASEPKN